MDETLNFGILFHFVWSKFLQIGLYSLHYFYASYAMLSKQTFQIFMQGVSKSIKMFHSWKSVTTMTYFLPKCKIDTQHIWKISKYTFISLKFFIVKSRGLFWAWIRNQPLLPKQVLLINRGNRWIINSSERHQGMHQGKHQGHSWESLSRKNGKLKGDMLQWFCNRLTFTFLNDNYSWQYTKHH